MRFVHATAFVSGRFLSDATVDVQGDRIASVTDAPVEPRPGDIDLRGAYLVPGFVDVHIHGYGGSDVMDGVDAVRHIARGIAAHGTTSFLPTTMAADADATRRAVAGIAEAMAGETVGARVLGAHMEGPFFEAEMKGAQPESALRNPSIEAYLDMARENEPIVRRLALAPNLPGAQPLVEYLASRGVAVGVGHTTSTYEQTLRAFSWGAAHVTHCFNACSPIHHRNPGVPVAAFDTAGASIEIISDGVHLHPAIVRMAVRLKGADRVMMITDSMMATGMGDGEFTLGGEYVKVTDGRAYNRAGKLAGSTLTQDVALRNLVAFGIPLPEALTMLTRTPALASGRTDIGAIRPGALADIVALDRDLCVQDVFVGGARVDR